MTKEASSDPSSLVDPWRWMPWALVALAFAIGLSVWSAFPPGIWNDDGVYVLIGRALAEGEGLRYLGVVGAPPAPKFPPLFPLLLAGVWTVFPAFPDNIPFLSGLNLVVLAVASGIFAVYLRKILKLSGPLTLFITLLAWISPQLWRVGLVPLSEPTFLLMLVLALWVGGRMESRPRGRTVLFFLLVGGLAVYARTLGVAVLAGGVVSLLLARKRGLALWTALGSGVLLLPWTLWTRAAQGSIPEPLLDTLGPYGGWLTGQILGDPLGFGQFVAGNVHHLLSRTLSLLIPGAGGGMIWVGLLLVPPLLLGLVDLFGRTRLLPLTLGFSFLILLLWPFQEIRLQVPYQPFLVLTLVLGFRGLLRGWSERRYHQRAVGLLAGAWVVSFVSVSVFQLATGWPSNNYRIRSEALIQAAEAVREKTPQGAVVGAPELWSGIHFLTGRTVVPSARFRPLGHEGPTGGTPEEQYELWIETGLTHILVEHGGQVHGDALDRIDALCPPGTVQLLDNRPGQFLVGLAWDSACQERVLSGEGDAAEGESP